MTKDEIEQLAKRFAAFIDTERPAGVGYALFLFQQEETSGETLPGPAGLSTTAKLDSLAHHVLDWVELVQVAS